MDITPGYGKRVKLARTERAFTQVGLARTALSGGASAKNIGRIENEQVKPRASTLTKIADATGVDVDWLLTGRTLMRENCVVRTAGIGRRINAYRGERGYSLRFVAEKSELGASAKNVSRLETGEHRPRTGTLERIASVLDVPVERLAFGA